MPMTPEIVAAVPPCDVDEVEAAAKRERKAAKRAAKEAAVDTTTPTEETDEAEAKRQRKAAKKAAKEAAATAKVQEAPVEEVDEVEAKRLRKAAKKAAKEAAAAAEAQEAPVEEVDEVEAKRLRKAAKKAAKEAAATAAEPGQNVSGEKDAPETPAKKEKRAVEAEDDVEEAPKAKKTKIQEEEATGADKGMPMVDEDKSLKVFIKGLPYSVEEPALRKDFAECGEIVQLQLPLNEEGTPKGFAFIQFATEAGFDAALKYDNTEYGGRYINVSKANDSGKGKGKDAKGKGKSKGKAGDWNCPNPDCGDLVFGRNSECRKCGTARPEGAGVEAGAAPARDNTNTVFVRGLPWSVGEEALRKDFAECGEIENLNLPLNEEGKPKGIAFIKYSTEAGVEAALKFDNTDYGGRTIFVAKAGEGKGKGKDGKGKSKDGKGKGKDSKGKAKGKSKGKGKATSEAKAKNTGCIVEGAGEKKTFADSDDE